MNSGAFCEATVDSSPLRAAQVKNPPYVLPPTPTPPTCALSLLRLDSHYRDEVGDTHLSPLHPAPTNTLTWQQSEGVGRAWPAGVCAKTASPDNPLTQQQEILSQQLLLVWGEGGSPGAVPV